MTTAADTPSKPSKLPLLIGLLLGLLAAAGGYVVTSGMFGAEPNSHDAAADYDDGHGDAAPVGAVAYVPIDPLLISINGDGASLLRFTAQLEVTPDQAATVASLRPRIIDVMNTYLRAVQPTDFTDPNALPRLRANLLRRIEIVVGGGAVQDLLIMEFVLN